MAQLKFYRVVENKRTPEERREALEFGKLGEQMAAKYLEDQGYSILEHNYRKGHLELDLIALDGDELVIVEVKTRSYDTILRPEDAVDHQKRLAMIRLGNQYVKSHGRTENVRLDVIAIVKNGHSADVKHIKNAFNIMHF